MANDVWSLGNAHDEILSENIINPKKSIEVRMVGRLPEIEQVILRRILQAFDDLVQLGFCEE